jgi:2-oxoisovalerate dehydrogenase E1 component alpha subunit
VTPQAARTRAPRPAARAADEPRRYVAEDGTLTPDGELVGVDLPLALTLYRDMYLGRRFDEQAYHLQRQGELGLWLEARGQEAAQVGTMRALRDTDYVFPSYREHIAAMVRGLGPRELLAQWRGVAHAGWDPARFRFHIYSLVLGTQTLHAVGYAMGTRFSGADEVVMCFVGDGATSQGDVSEALNWAATRELPIVFVVQNNGWAISTPVSRQYKAPLPGRAAGFGLASYSVDGNDALAVHAVVSEAVAGVRAGGPPAFVEAITYRMAGHSTSDDPRRYRGAEEEESWFRKDPVRRLETLLRSLGTGDEYFAALEAEGDEVAAATRAACAELEDPDLLDLFDRVYVDPHPDLERQRAAAAALRVYP